MKEVMQFCAIAMRVQHFCALILHVSVARGRMLNFFFHFLNYLLDTFIQLMFWQE